MYDLYIANKNYSSWSLRPWVLMNELAIDFREHITPFPADRDGAAFRTFSPTGKVPALHDGTTVVWDSLGITEYLAERHPGVWPANPDARAWARCAAAEMHSGFTALRERCSMTCGLRVRLHEQPPALLRDLARIDELWRAGLDRFSGPFLAGSAFSAVDAFFAPVAFRIQTYGVALDPRSAAYAGRLLALPSMQRWYADALAETWRDLPHEAEVVSYGTIVEDLRAH
ncbi:MAG: glutathione S-transferase family protein [Deltaproteobacteria bacterium]|nr:glutathione S-transferase family protein [Deltaproteobacteria bacterium]